MSSGNKKQEAEGEAGRCVIQIHYLEIPLVLRHLQLSRSAKWTIAGQHTPYFLYQKFKLSSDNERTNENFETRNRSLVGSDVDHRRKLLPKSFTTFKRNNQTYFKVDGVVESKKEVFGKNVTTNRGKNTKACWTRVPQSRTPIQGNQKIRHKDKRNIIESLINLSSRLIV